MLSLAQDQKLLVATLERCAFEGPDARGVVTVKLATERRMHRDRLASPGLQQQVSGFVNQACGKPVQVQFEVVESQSQAKPADSKPPGKVASKVMERFGGRVVAVDPDDVRPQPKSVEQPLADIPLDIEVPPPEEPDEPEESLGD